MEESSSTSSSSNKGRRLILHNFISTDQCKELEYIHKSNSTVGYRPNVFSTTLSHLIATNSSHFLIPFVPIRERLKEIVEEFFNCQYELVIEFTGLISWTKGSNIAWHSDDNRPYLKQRHFTAVCYLNAYDKDFKGGLFHFQHGHPSTLIPMPGDVAIYTADNHNIHSVDEVTHGERLTLTLWFSRDSNHDEDAKLISLLSQNMLRTSTTLPLPASTTMYWFTQNQASSDHQSGFDICCARMHVDGFDIFSSQYQSCIGDAEELLIKPLQLSRQDELFGDEFSNVLHALQVVQFYCWKGSELENFERETRKEARLTQSEREIVQRLKSIFIKDHQLANGVFNFSIRDSSTRQPFDWGNFSSAMTAWKNYICKLRQELLLSLPYWKSYQSIHSVQFDGL
ncbi:hypothetical protein ACFE04_020593 [Oxalis oulophora]